MPPSAVDLDSPMLIACQNCGTSYQIDPASLGPTGRSVRCMRCRHVWFVANTDVLSAIARDHRAELAALRATSSVDDLPAPPPELAAPPPVADEAVAGAAPSDDEASEPAAAADWAMADPPAADAANPDPLSPDLPGDGQSFPPPEPAVIADAPALAPTDPGETAPPGDASPPEDIESVAARRAPHRATGRGYRWLMNGWANAILALIAINMALIGWRADLVRLLPQTASLYAAIGLSVNLRGLAFTDLRNETETQDGVQVLVVEGTIASTATRAVDVPRLRFAVRNGSGQEIYAWTALPPKSVLAPGETTTFRSRLASPPRETREVLVRFFNRRDLAAGIQ